MMTIARYDLPARMASKSDSYGHKIGFFEVLVSYYGRVGSSPPRAQNRRSGETGAFFFAVTTASRLCRLLAGSQFWSQVGSWSLLYGPVHHRRQRHDPNPAVRLRAGGPGGSVSHRAARSSRTAEPDLRRAASAAVSARPAGKAGGRSPCRRCWGRAPGRGTADCRGRWSWSGRGWCEPDRRG